MSDYNADANPDLDRIRQVAFCFLLAPQADLKVDQFSTLTSLKVYSLNRRHLKTRLIILVDPADVPHD